MYNVKPLIRVLNGEIISPPPCWLMRQAGRYLPEYRQIRSTAENFLDFCFTPELAVEATRQPLRRFGFDAAIMFSDILVIPHGLGQKVTFKQGQGPILDALKTSQDIAKLDLSMVRSRLAPVMQTLREIAAGLDDSTTLIGFAGSPFTVALYMIEGRGGTEGTKVRRWAAERPDEFAALIDVLCSATSTYLIEQVNSGAEVLQLFDSWAGLLPESQFRKWIIEPNRRIVESVHAVHPEVPIIGFPRNAGVLYRDFVDGTGVQGISIDSTVPLKWAAKELQPLCTVQGNLDNHLLYSGGITMEEEVRAILSVLGGGPLIFNLGHGVLPLTPVENVARIIEIIRGTA